MAVKDRFPDALIQFEDFQTDMVGPTSAPCYHSHMALCIAVGLPYRTGTLAGPPLRAQMSAWWSCAAGV